MLSNLSLSTPTPQLLLPISHYKNLNNIVENNYFDNFIRSFIKNFKPITDDFYGDYILPKKKPFTTKYRRKVRTKWNKDEKQNEDIQNVDLNGTQSERLEEIKSKSKDVARGYNFLARGDDKFSNASNMNFTGNYTKPEWSTRKKCMMFTALWNM